LSSFGLVALAPDLALLARLRGVLGDEPVTETELRGLIEQTDGLVRALGAHVAGSEHRLTELSDEPDSSLREIASELLATNPARLFGLYPRKGTVAVGSDADLVVFDPEKRVTISASTHHSKSDYNLFEGTEVTGAPDVVLLRGNVLVEGGELVASPGIGQFVKRARFGEELSATRTASAT
jgi:cytosine/adenosine deaminase-related metal-dependent hydrolase